MPPEKEKKARKTRTPKERVAGDQEVRVHYVDDKVTGVTGTIHFVGPPELGQLTETEAEANEISRVKQRTNVVTIGKLALGVDKVVVRAEGKFKNRIVVELPPVTE